MIEELVKSTKELIVALEQWPYRTGPEEELLINLRSLIEEYEKKTK